MEIIEKRVYITHGREFATHAQAEVYGALMELQDTEEGGDLLGSTVAAIIAINVNIIRKVLAVPPSQRNATREGYYEALIKEAMELIALHRFNGPSSTDPSEMISTIDALKGAQFAHWYDRAQALLDGLGVSDERGKEAAAGGD